MSEMVERVATAISLRTAEIMIGQDPRAVHPDPRALARAAIAAMREPSEAMLDELDLANCGWGLREHSKELWQDLIDVALK